MRAQAGTLSGYRFSICGHFADNESVWQSHLSHLRDRPVHCLEIGCLEGESTIWIVAELLSHPDARLVCVDPWPDPEIEARFDFNVRQTGRPDRIVKIKGFSQEALPAITNRFEFAYIDGSHEARDLMSDAVHTWRLLAPSGILIFDDYEWHGTTVRLPPRVGIDAFLFLWASEIEALHRGWQVIVRKIVERASVVRPVS